MGHTAHSKETIDVETYLRGELASEVRHEYVGGRLYAMVGCSDSHNLIAMNLGTALHQHLRGDPCQVFMSDMKVRLQHAGEEAFYYPDLLVSCEPQDRARYWREQPCLVVEILSETTARIDRQEKLLAYREIAALQEYLLIEQDSAGLTLMRRAESWQPRPLALGDTLRLESLGLEIPVTELYEGVDLSTDRQ